MVEDRDSTNLGNDIDPDTGMFKKTSLASDMDDSRGSSKYQDIITLVRETQIIDAPEKFANSVVKKVYSKSSVYQGRE